MLPADHSDAPVAAVNPFTAADVVAILRERGWLIAEPSLEQHAWCERAASMLGGHATDRTALADLLGLVFQYDAREIISRVESHVVLSRYAARGVHRKGRSTPRRTPLQRKKRRKTGRTEVPPYIMEEASWRR